MNLAALDIFQSPRRTSLVFSRLFWVVSVVLAFIDTPLLGAVRAVLMKNVPCNEVSFNNADLYSSRYSRIPRCLVDRLSILLSSVVFVHADRG